MKLKRFTLLMLLGVTCAASAQTKGKVVKAAQTVMSQHTVHVLVCTRPGPQNPEPQLRIILTCRNDAPNCVQPFAGSQGYMEDLDPDSIYEGHNVRVEWLDGKDGTQNVVGAYQVQSSSAEKCEVN